MHVYTLATATDYNRVFIGLRVNPFLAFYSDSLLLCHLDGSRQEARHP